jgi:hypothetical protein
MLTWVIAHLHTSVTPLRCRCTCRYLTNEWLIDGSVLQAFAYFGLLVYYDLVKTEPGDERFDVSNPIAPLGQ